ncbi:MAG: hypothetical protein J6S49_02405 [Erysipelotrichaceae bacterium]|nr:hypothetical protein [Erysipelotrichaceae bacterium]MBO7698759.1 hypothetical protein [Erysipelotrichaceae bacterium]
MSSNLTGTSILSYSSTAEQAPYKRQIPGLYAVGNVSGDMYAVDYPINFMGNSHGRCLVGGYSVGTYLANL